MRPIPAILFAFVSLLIAAPLSADTRPNVIVVMTDDKYVLYLE